MVLRIATAVLLLVTVAATFATADHPTVFSGRVVELNGTPVRAATVSYSPHRRHSIENWRRTDEEGRFTFVALHDSSYDLEVWAHGFVHTELTNVTPNARDILIRLPRSPLLRLSVSIPDGQPTPTAAIGEARADRNLTYHLEFTRANDGLLETILPTLSAATMSVWIPGYRTAYITGSRYDPGSIVCHQVALETGGTVTGIVRTRSGKPVTGAIVSILGHTPMDGGYPTSSDGSFVVLGAPSGEFELFASHPVHGSGSTFDRLVVPPGARITAVVIDLEQ